ncbi:CYFA0S03e04148g1_1 [Cyberlindnera fabianii]|uniref:Arylsulfatase n=1 Tax=Cyberlindnera fabianii TaxID=36022 RepID=A0A061APJ0_CYBFA|nr:Arylsulfatase [Cyberlindnera fabianii]CDR39505.1 CYFA0S03e04148g1_1 [Cyberlindnera fabianii]
MTKQPNFLIIVADDLGFTDTSPYGGEISTPNLNRIANHGLRFTDFHTASACSPTRSMLLSGTDNHIAGLGQMDEFLRQAPDVFEGKPGYEGYLNFRVAALSEILKENGYYNFISGKWHLGNLPEYWPGARGFEKSFGLLSGGGNHYKYFPKDENGNHIKFLEPIYQENGRRLDADTEIPDDFYSTVNYTDKFLEQLNHEDRKGRPFFGFLTYTSPHWPYQAPDEVIAKYKGRYNAGPEELRKQRLAKAAQIGIIPDGVEPHQVETMREKAWKDLDDYEKACECRIMEVYAAMVDVMDQQIGRVYDRLVETGEIDNTFILFMSDNGAEGMLLEAMAVRNENAGRIIKKYFDNSLDNIGKPNSHVWYSDQWAQAATAPHFMYKMWASEGGIRCPMIVHYPDLVKKEDEGKVKREFITVMDILPTVLDIAGIKHPAPEFQGRRVVTPRGSSWVKYITGESDHVHDEDKVHGWELFSQQAIRKGHYKALFIPKPAGPEKWQLFNLKTDPGENHDLAETEPEILKELLDHWVDYVAETGLVEATETLRDVMHLVYKPTVLYH